MTPRLSLSTLEYATLSAFPEADSNASPVDLAVTAQLTGSQVREAIELLKDRGLVEIVSDSSIKLSNEGEVVRRRLDRQTLVIDLSDGSGAVVIESEEALDSALEKALAKLQA